MAGQPSALQNRIRQWINGIEVVESTDVQVQKPRPVGQKFGAKGLIGNYKGQAGGRVQITFAQVSDRSQFETFAESLSDFTYVFDKGSAKFIMTNCEMGDTDIRGNYESGDTSTTLSIIGASPRQIA